MIDDNVAAVRRKLRDRSELGQAKYGCTTDGAMLSPREWLVHLQEELMDAAVYIEALINDVAAETRDESKCSSSETLPTKDEHDE